MRPTLITAAALLLAACGTTSPAEPAADAPADEEAQQAAADEPEEPAEEPADEPAADEPTADDQEWPEAEPPEDPDTWTPPPAEERENDDDIADDDTADEPAVTTTSTTEAPAEAVDPCAGSPTALSVADGPAPDIAVTPEADAASPLPDLAVRRINCGGGWVNLRNEIPSDLPVLIWAWAPH